MRKLDSVLNKNEEILWEGKPLFAPFFIKNLSKGAIFLLIFYGLLFFIFVYVPMNPITNYNPPIFFLSEIFLLSYLALLCLIAFLVRIDYNNTYYVISDKRAIRQRGIIGIDFDIVDYDKVSNAFVNIGFLDKIFNTGTIYVVGGRLLTFSYITNPYDIFKFFKKTSFDIKTDIYFPNKYRPAENPGYRTKYRPKD